ncbi:MAG TPA: caspase family protein [Chitinophagaceae bacterium]|nr:caspase family protein [Chitinophagaceae bacterium]
MRTLLFIIIYFLTGSAIIAQTPLKERDTTIKGSQTFALIVGVSKYKYVRPLSFADKDAEMFRDYLKSPAGGSVKNDNIFCLLNEEAICSNFWTKGFQWLKAKKLRSGDRLFIYLAGHGDAIDEDQFFFLGYDCNPAGDKNNYLAGGAIQLFNLKKKIATETSKGVEVFFIMDACRTSELPGGLPGLNFLNTAITEKRVGEIIMLATGAGQESLEDASIGTGHGLFTYYLVDGLAGTADSIGISDNKISFEEIQRYVSNNVPSVAQQRFKRNQQPYFCCNESSQKIIGIVDTNYLNNWLKTKRLQQKGPGNSFQDFFYNNTILAKADTSLTELYDLFYKTVKNKNITGHNSAEYYYEQLEKKFTGNSYTLDARSTLAVEYIKDAQSKIDLFITCGNAASPLEKKDFAEAGNRLEKAINIINEYDPDYAASLKSNMYLLKASDGNMRFQNAYAARALSPDAAYINNQLAILHLENNRPDSAVYYASKAAGSAPNWKCAYTTLTSAYKALNIPDSVFKYQQISGSADLAKPVNIPTKKEEVRKTQLGIEIGGGINNFKLNFSSWKQGNINYNDSLNNITTSNGAKFDLGLICQINFGETVALRPLLSLAFETGNIIYDRKTPTGERHIETLKIETTSMNASLPLIFKFSQKKVAPYFSAGPSFNYMLSQDESSSSKLPIRSFTLFGDAGLGVDIDLLKTAILSSELKFSASITDINEDANNLYTNTLSSLKKQTFMLSIYLRRK